MWASAVSARLFGTAGARGVTNVEITPEMAMRLGALWARNLASRAGAKVTLSVGHDTRWGAEMLARAAAAGIVGVGQDAAFHGCVPTGAICVNLRASGHAGGIFITGSHMPPERTGVILLRADGTYAPFDETDLIEEGYRAFRWTDVAVPPAQLGHLIDSFHSFETYVAYVVQHVDAPALKQRRFRVLVDPANGAASLVAKELFQWLGCEVEMIHYDPAPVPERPSEPRAGTVTAARRRVRELGLDLGICVDVDADRLVLIDEHGEPAGEDTVGALFAREELRKGDVCVVPINSSGLIEQVCDSIGARLEYCPPGQPLTAKAMRDLAAVYSYEESGKYYFARLHLWSDALFNAARMLEILHRHGRPLSALVAELPRFHQVKRTVAVPNAVKPAVVALVRERWTRELTDGRARDVEIDGLKRTYRDRSWLLIRASGTEELIRVMSDAPDEARALALADAGVALVEEVLRETGGQR